MDTCVVKDIMKGTNQQWPQAGTEPCECTLPVPPASPGVPQAKQPFLGLFLELNQSSLGEIPRCCQQLLHQPQRWSLTQVRRGLHQDLI